MRNFFFASLVLAGSGCALFSEAPEQPATAGVVTDPEALCAEHGVLQPVCPKCNPALAAVFQAKGDWCAEHGFPESFCPICKPDLGGRPAVDVAAGPKDGAPADRTKIRFKSREAATLAGVETVAAIAAEREESIATVARVVYDAAKVALVSAPAPGVVTHVRADVGTRVRKGTPLATIQSATIGAGRSSEAALRSRVSFTQQSVDRQREMLGAGVVSAQEVAEAEQALGSAQAELAALESQLAMVGHGNAGEYTLLAPLSGEITRREATLGMAVEGSAPLFEIVDASTMWAELDVPEADLAQVAVGNAATLVLDTLPDRVFLGTVAYIAPSVSVATRTALARIALDNADRALRGNMYGQARIIVTDAQPTVVVPAASVQHAKGVDLVFVQLAQDEFEARRVVVRARSGNEVRLASGIAAGEPVVTTGAFLLKTETLKDSIGAGCCDVE